MLVTFCAELCNLASGTVLYHAKEINAKIQIPGRTVTHDSKMSYMHVSQTLFSFKLTFLV